MNDPLLTPLAGRLARRRMGDTLTLWRRTLALLGGPARLALPTLARPWPDESVPVPTDRECRARRCLALPGPVLWMAAPVGTDGQRGAVTLDYVPGRRSGQWRATVHRYGGRLVRTADSPFIALARTVYTAQESWRPALRLGDLKHAAELAARTWHGDAGDADPRFRSE
ncbi:MAG: hypothetical protein V2I24_09245 [Halieaceae bacterium]|jgi:hypothetical protein|nr:hypothetical protein [Halieaceae bacterium]